MSQNLGGNEIAGITACFGNAGITEAGTTAGAIEIVNNVDYAINGVMYTKAAADNIAITATAEQAALTSCLYLITLNAAGTVATVKGTEELTAALSDNRASLVLPKTPADVCPIGYFRIDTAAATVFIGNTTDLSATGITDTIVNLASQILGTIQD